MKKARFTDSQKVALTLWWDGCFHDDPLERTGRGKSPPQKNVCRRKVES
ncbi:Uncharacterised protein [Providencia stuartii]|nr:Uncharacterised protein [Providencia stuartii]